MEQVGLIIFAAVFVMAGIRHIQKHADMIGYTASVLGDCPIKNQLAYLGGWPVGVFLAAFGTGVAFNDNSVFAYGIAGFLALATVLFHRDIKDPGTTKNIALLGAALAIAANVA